MAPKFLLPLPARVSWLGPVGLGQGPSWEGGPSGGPVYRGSCLRSPGGCADCVTLSSPPDFSGCSSQSQSGASLSTLLSGWLPHSSQKTGHSAAMTSEPLLQPLGPQAPPLTHTPTSGPLHGCSQSWNRKFAPHVLGLCPHFSAQVPVSGRSSPAPQVRPLSLLPWQPPGTAPYFEHCLACRGAE